MSGSVPVELTGFRWSLARTCPRMAVYAERNTPGSEPSEQLRRYWKMGHLVEDVVVGELIDLYGEDDIERQRVVRWPAGEAHVDAFILSQGHPCEIKHHRDGSFSEEDLVQLAGHLRWDPDSQGVGTLIIVDRDLEKEEIPLRLNQAWSDRVEALAEQVVWARDTGGLPDRVCERPSDARGRFCPFAEECFADWDAPLPVQIHGDVAELASELLVFDERIRSATEGVDKLKAERAVIRDRLLHEMEPNTDYDCGGLIIRATEIRRTTWKVQDAFKAGVVSEELMAPFMRVGEPHYRWTIKIGEGIGFTGEDLDFGDVPF